MSDGPGRATHPSRRRVTAGARLAVRSRVAALVWVALVIVAAPHAAAYPENQAANLRIDIVAAGHEPAEVAPHTQWSAFLTVTPDSNITAASYQVCRVGAACFAPPTPANRTGDTFRFSTRDVPANAVDFQPHWLIGVKWILTARDLSQQAFPQGPDLLSPACQGAASMSCQEQHYLTFAIAEEPAKSSSVPGLPAAALACLVAAVLRVRSRRHA